jgi:hypothetical protein
MNPLIIEGKDNITPRVMLDNEKGTFEISGWSHPEDAIKCYAPVFDWLNKYAENPNEEMIFNFRFQYFNSSSTRQIFKLISLLENIYKGNKVKIHWHYDSADTDMLSEGERFSTMSTIVFEFISH